MKKILFTLALLISFSFLSHSQRAILGKKLLKVNYIDGRKQGEEIGYYESGKVKYKVNYVDGISRGEEIYYSENGEVEWKGYDCGFYESSHTMIRRTDLFVDYQIYITPIKERYNDPGKVMYFNLDDFERLKENIDTVSNKSVLKKENNIFQFEFYNKDNLNVYENPENLKSFIAQLDNKYIEITDEYLKVINTKGRKKSHYEYTANFTLRQPVGVIGNLGYYYELNYFNDGYKEILNFDDQIYRRYDKYQLVESNECDGNKSITKYFDKNGKLFVSMEKFTEKLDSEITVYKELITRFYPSGNRSIFYSYYENINYYKFNKTVDKNRTMEVYSEDGVFSVKVVIDNYKIDSDNQLIKTEGIINGDTINVYKISENGEKEVYTTMEFKFNPKKQEKSLKRLLKKLNSF